MNSLALLLEVSPLKLMLLWGELVEAYYGVHPHGSDTALIYAFQFLPYMGTAEAMEPGEYFKARHKLNALLELFCTAHNCQALVDGRLPNHYQHETFSWRAQVQIVKIAREEANNANAR